MEQSVELGSNKCLKINCVRFRENRIYVWFFVLNYEEPRSVVLVRKSKWVRNFTTVLYNRTTRRLFTLRLYVRLGHDDHISFTDWLHLFLHFWNSEIWQVTGRKAYFFPAPRPSSPVRRQIWQSYPSNFQTMLGSPGRGTITVLIPEISFRLSQCVWSQSIRRYRRTADDITIAILRYARRCFAQ